MSQQAHMPDAQSALAVLRMEIYGCKVHDLSPQSKGLIPSIEALEGQCFPMEACNGVHCLKIRPVRDAQRGKLPETWLYSYDNGAILPGTKAYPYKPRDQESNMEGVNKDKMMQLLKK